MRGRTRGTALLLVGLVAACSRGRSKPAAAREEAAPPAMTCGAPLPAPAFRAEAPPSAPPPPSDRRMVVELDAEPATLLPLVHPDWLSWTILGHLVQESLVRVDRTTGRLVGELAETFEVDPTRTRWTFHLRKGAAWHDGAPLTVDDVLFTFDRLLDPTVGAPDRTLFAGAKVTKVGPDDVEVKLPAPIASPEIAFDRVLILPHHRFPRGDLSRSEGASAPVGTGPMRFVSWTRGTEIALSRYGRYWGPPAPVTEMVFRFMPSRPSVLAALDHGDLDVVPRASVEVAEHVEETPALAAQYDVLRAGGFDYTAWIYNVNAPGLRDVRVRRALGASIPRAAIRAEVERCGVEIALGPLPLGHEALEGVEPPPFDPTRAARLLDEAGIVDKNGDGVREVSGAPFRLTLIYPASSRQQERSATVIADELRRLGVALELSPVEWAEFLRRVEGHEFEVASIEWSIDTEPDLFPLFHSSQAAGGLNYGGYSSPEVDRWLDELRAQPVPSRRKELLHEVVLRLRADEPYSFLFSPRIQAVVRKGAAGVVPTPLGWEPRGWGWGAAPRGAPR